MNWIIELWQSVYYGLLHRTPKVDFSVMPASFRFDVHYDKKNRVYWIDSPDLPDFEATGKTIEELAAHIKDTIYVYFDIPRYFAKRDNSVSDINIPDPRTGQAKTFRVSRRSLENVLAGA